MNSRIVQAVVLAIGFCSTAQTSLAQKSKPEPPFRDAVTAMFEVHQFLQAQISPDGKQTAWVESLPGPGGAPSSNSAIYVANLASPSLPKRITAASDERAHEEHDIAWSADSKRIAFLSDARTPGQLQLFVADAAGVSARQLTHWKGFLAGPAWSPNGKRIALLFTENATRSSGPLVAETPDEGVVSDKFLEQRLTLVDPTTSQSRQISAADMYVYEFDWSPDSQRLVITAAHGNGDDNWYVAGLYTIAAASGSLEPVAEKPGMQIAGPRWSPDGSEIAFIGGLMSDEPAPGGDVYVSSAAGESRRNLTSGMKATADSLTWSPDSRSLILAGIADGQVSLDRLELDGARSTLWSRAETIAEGAFAPDVSIARDGKTFAVIRQSFAAPPEVWAGEIGNWKQITHRNARLKAAWGEAKSLHWTSDGLEVQGWLIYPRDFDPSKTYPLVVDVHGGPSWASLPAWPDRWTYTMALPAAGYFLLQPNPRGSYGQGETFTEANVKDFGYGDFRDVMTGIDRALNLAPIDKNRLGITGWSYGGYMPMWSVTQTDRFRAAVSGAGLADWLSYYGENKIDQWMVPFFGASVYDDPAVYAKSSPITFIKNVKTPTLLLVGDSDGECPPPQSYEFWHALKTTGVPTQLVIYPREGHMLVTPSHSRDVIDRTVAWFNQYLQ